jgi:hypothetical protein
MGAALQLSRLSRSTPIKSAQSSSVRNNPGQW